MSTIIHHGRNTDCPTPLPNGTCPSHIVKSSLERACELATVGVMAAFEPMYDGEPKPTHSQIAAIIYRYMREMREI